MDMLKHWTRIIDDTLVFVRPGTLEEMPESLNLFDLNIKFIYDKENGRKIPFLDVHLERMHEAIETSVKLVAHSVI